MAGILLSAQQRLQTGSVKCPFTIPTSFPFFTKCKSNQQLIQLIAKAAPETEGNLLEADKAAGYQAGKPELSITYVQIISNDVLCQKSSKGAHSDILKEQKCAVTIQK